MKKTPKEISDEELLDGLEEEEADEIFHEDDFLSFLSYYNFQPGEHRVASSVIWTLYKHWSKDPITQDSLYQRLPKYFESVIIRGYKYYSKL